MDERERLNTLLEHWIKHNESHIKSYKEWVEKLKDSEFSEVSQKIEEAAKITSRANEKIKEAKNLVGSDPAKA